MSSFPHEICRSMIHYKSQFFENLCFCGYFTQYITAKFDIEKFGDMTEFYPETSQLLQGNR